MYVCMFACITETNKQKRNLRGEDWLTGADEKQRGCLALLVAPGEDV